MSGIEYLGFVAGILVVIVFFKREVDDLRKKVEQLQKQLDAMQDSVESLDPVAIGAKPNTCLLYTSPSPRDYAASRMPSSA